MEDVFYSVLTGGDSVITWVATFVVGLIGKYLVDKIQSDTTRKYVKRALDEVYDAVAEVYQSYVSDLKEFSEDGKLTEEEKAIAKEAALDIAKNNIGTKGLGRLGRVLGLDLDEVDTWLDNKVEASIAGTKAAAPLSEEL